MTSDIDKTKNVFYIGQKYQLEQSDTFKHWFDKLRDRTSKIRIADRLFRLADDAIGDTKPLGDGVIELRCFFGPGYRVYYMFRGDVLILLLCGGDKDSQQRDIERAKAMAREERDGAEDDAV